MKPLDTDRRSKLLINFGPLKKGGGQNVALNFIYELIKSDQSIFEIYFVVCEDSTIHNVISKTIWSDNIVTVSENPVRRIFQEFTLVNKFIKDNSIELLFTYFGFALTAKNVKQIIGSADSNLYFPEVDFWSHYKGIARFKKWIIDNYRILGLKRATAVIYENEVLEVRAKELFHLKNTSFIKPSVNFEMDSELFELPFVKGEKQVGLFLCGWQLNKNIMLIPEIALQFKERGIDFHFIITAPEDNSPIHKKFCTKVAKFNVENMVSIVGNVDKKELRSLYEQIDVVFLLSLLESFSNNIIESWYFEKPLIIANEEWSRSLCKEAAIYVNRDSVRDIVDESLSVILYDEIRAKLISEGKIELATYPTINNRIERELRYLEYVAKTS